MSIYRLIGIMRCPFIDECGPDRQWIDYEIEIKGIEKTCLTRRHRGCDEYMLKMKKAAESTS